MTMSCWRPHLGATMALPSAEGATRLLGPMCSQGLRCQCHGHVLPVPTTCNFSIYPPSHTLKKGKNERNITKPTNSTSTNRSHGR